MAEHTWNVVRILATVWPLAPASAILFAQFHDVAEVGTGDLPYPVKAHNAEIAAEMNRLEAETVSEMGLMHHLTVDPHWQRRVKVCDCLEMWEFGLDEMHMGNRFADLIVSRMDDLVWALVRQYGLTAEETAAVKNYTQSRRSRY